jgi:DNA mismatch repair protein MutL
LAEHDIVFHNTGWGKSVYGDEDVFNQSTKSYAGNLLKDQSLPWSLQQPLQIDKGKVVQMHNLYLIVQTKNGFVLIDQHAAHERIRYEQLLEAFQKQKKQDTLFHFPKPKVIDFGIAESELVQEHLETINALGFVMEHFKNNSFLLRSLPKIFHDRDYKVLLTEMLEDLREEKKSEIDSITKRMIAYLACHGAVKAGDTLDEKQCADLIKQLEKTANNATCPHGRPTKVIIHLEELQKMFKR